MKCLIFFFFSFFPTIYLIAVKPTEYINLSFNGWVVINSTVFLSICVWNELHFMRHYCWSHIKSFRFKVKVSIFMVTARIINACWGQVAIKYFEVQHFSPVSPGLDTLHISGKVILIMRAHIVIKCYTSMKIYWAGHYILRIKQGKSTNVIVLDWHVYTPFWVE